MTRVVSWLMSHSFEDDVDSRCITVLEYDPLIPPDLLQSELPVVRYSVSHA